MTGNPRNAMVCDTPYLQNEFGDPRFFLHFLPNFYHFLPTVKVLKKSVSRNFWVRTSLITNLVILNKLVTSLHFYCLINNSHNVGFLVQSALLGWLGG